MTSDHPWDTGLQPERTALAWSRFSIALAVVGVATLRTFSHPRLDWTSVLSAGFVLVTALVIGQRGSARYGTSHRAMHDQRTLPGGLLLAASASAGSALGLFALACLLM